MSYRLNKTNGDLIIELADGQIDNTSTDITLVGRNYKGFGEFINENFIKIVENFANSNAPDAPLVGQLWYDISQEKVKVYNGTDFRPAGAPILSPTRPPLAAGDLWIDNRNRKLYFYDGNTDNELTLVGPIYDNAQGLTGFEVESVIDVNEREQVVLKMFLGGSLVAVIADDEFRVSGVQKVTGYPDDPNDSLRRQFFEQGINVVDAEFRFRGTADASRALVDAEGNERTTANFLPTDENGETIGSLFVKNSNGVSIGVNDINYASFKLIGTTATIETQQSNTDLALRTRIGNQFLNGVYLDADTARVGIFETTPDYTLDVNGDFRAAGNAVVDGDLTVNGEATYINVGVLRVEDKNIELGLLDDSTEGADSDVDNAGIIVRSTDGSKDFLWQQQTNSFYSNVNIDIMQGRDYKINGQTVLSANSLPTVTSANSLESIGTLNNLTVNERITVNQGEIKSNTDLILDSFGDIKASGSVIKEVSEPQDAADAATKNYVDIEIDSIDVAIALDITGLADRVSDVAGILNQIASPLTKQPSTRARIHATSYDELIVSGIDIQSAANISTISVLTDDSSAESVVQDISFAEASGSTTPTPNRRFMIYEVIEVGATREWNLVSDTEL
jgi:hypothetical protein